MKIKDVSGKWYDTPKEQKKKKIKSKTVDKQSIKLIDLVKRIERIEEYLGL